VKCEFCTIPCGNDHCPHWADDDYYQEDYCFMCKSASDLTLFEEEMKAIALKYGVYVENT
jgi:hypothetical protein